MAAATSIFTALFLFAASLCAGHCDVKLVKAHACCHHEKVPVHADLACAHARDKVQVSFPLIDLGAAPQTLVAGFVSIQAERAPEARPPDLSPPHFRTLRI